ncbi:hypothetical protein CRG98_006183 [Punica granatum]|uniref:Uncharacterized protein n=1 Tax=Punica granatum TaxID=22663 RepID=A0A2I0KYI0_PUNGR|nr:hypothetical protein CRG98_006183 [Punica granatum]
MATNMAEFFALLRGANHAFSRSTPPPGQGPTVNTPFWPTGFLHENPRSKPGLLFITRQSKTNARSWSHEQWEKSWIRLLGVQRTQSHTVPWSKQACRPVFPKLPRLRPLTSHSTRSFNRVSRLSRPLPRLFSSNIEASMTGKDPNWGRRNPPDSCESWKLIATLGGMWPRAPLDHTSPGCFPPPRDRNDRNRRKRPPKTREEPRKCSVTFFGA